MERFKDWVAVRKLGEGGQGQVFLVVRVPDRELTEATKRIANTTQASAWPSLDARFADTQYPLLTRKSSLDQLLEKLPDTETCMANATGTLTMARTSENLFGRPEDSRYIGHPGFNTFETMPIVDSPLLAEIDDSNPARINLFGASRIDKDEIRCALEEWSKQIALSEPGALKVLHKPERAKNSRTAAKRLKKELRALREVSHPALIRLLDADEKDCWFVTEYFPDGTLETHADLFKGNVVGALQALRPIVEAVSLLHDKRWVHRDIKPDNVFVVRGCQLVLGDLGLAYVQETTRITETNEMVGTWQWCPPWAVGRRLIEVPPEFDTFCLGKLLFWMISGGNTLPLHYWDDSAFNLEQQFPEHPLMKLANELISLTVRERKGKGLEDATVMLEKLDSVLQRAIRQSRRTAEIE